VTKEIKIGNVLIGGDHSISIQSMTNTDTADIDASVRQINALEAAGCEIIRLTANNEASAKAFKVLRSQTTLPLVADIHFDYKLAILAIENGADKIRINPGNIGGDDRLKPVVDAAKAAGIPIRVGVNGGSLEKDILEKYGVSAEGLAQSALNNIARLERMDFYDIVVSVKSSDVLTTVKANQILSQKSDYPIHFGVTEAGTKDTALIKTAAAFSPLLMDGIGDTIRVSITGNPVEEIYAAKKILRSLGLRREGVEIVSCPTCGRTQIDVEKLATDIENALIGFKKPIKVAVMGCVVNGPGEAKDADIGVAGGVGEGLIFVKGEKLKKVKEDALVDTLLQYINDNF